jgi:RimJ/RimL family protein N-acetyltransferase
VTQSIPVADAIAVLASAPLRNMVLLKQLMAYPAHVRVHRATGAEGGATLVALDTAASAYDREAYPQARLAAFIASDHPHLTASLLPALPRGTGIVFKLASEADLEPVAASFAVARHTAFLSFTANGARQPAPDVGITTAPGDAAFRMLEQQGHARAWLEPLLQDGKAFAATLARDGAPLAVCIAYEIYASIWEVGGLVTDAAHRRQGHGARVVRAVLAELSRRGLTPRYQAEEHNAASIALARSVGLERFLTLTHYLHRPA